MLFHSKEFPMAQSQFTGHGEVIKTIGRDIGVRVENEPEMRSFWRTHKIDTDLDWFGPGAPVISIGRQEDIASCTIGDRVSITVQIEDRPNGKRGIKTIDFQVLARKS
jgi:hypothetical protein